MGPNAPGLAWPLTGLGELAMEEGRFAEAEARMRRALKIREDVFGETHPEVAHSLIRLAELYLRQAKDAEAESLARQALAIAERANLHTGTPRSLDILGRVATRKGKYAEAESFFNRSLDLMRKSLPPDHPDLVRVRRHLAELHRRWK